MPDPNLPSPYGRPANHRLDRLMGNMGRQYNNQQVPAVNGAWKPPATPAPAASIGGIAGQAQHPMDRVAGQIQTLANRPAPAPAPAPTPAGPLPSPYRPLPAATPSAAVPGPPRESMGSLSSKVGGRVNAFNATTTSPITSPVLPAPNRQLPAPPPQVNPLRNRTPGTPPPAPPAPTPAGPTPYRGANVVGGASPPVPAPAPAPSGPVGRFVNRPTTAPVSGPAPAAPPSPPVAPPVTPTTAPVSGPAPSTPPARGGMFPTFGAATSGARSGLGNLARMPVGQAASGLMNSPVGRMARVAGRAAPPLVALDAVHNLGGDAVQNVADMVVGHNTSRGHGAASFMGMPIGKGIDDLASLLTTGHPEVGISPQSVGPMAQARTNGMVPPTSTDAMFRAAMAHPGSTINPDGKGGVASDQQGSPTGFQSMPVEAPPTAPGATPSAPARAWSPETGYDLTGRSTRELSPDDLNAIFKGARVFGGNQPAASAAPASPVASHMEFLRRQLETLSRPGERGTGTPKQRAAMYESLAGAYGRTIEAQLQSQGHVEAARFGHDTPELRAAKIDGLHAQAEHDRRNDHARPDPTKQIADMIANPALYEQFLISQKHEPAEARSIAQAAYRQQQEQQHEAAMTPVQRRQSRARKNLANPGWNQR